MDFRVMYKYNCKSSVIFIKYLFGWRSHLILLVSVHNPYMCVYSYNLLHDCLYFVVAPICNDITFTFAIFSRFSFMPVCMDHSSLLPSYLFQVLYPSTMVTMFHCHNYLHV